MLVPDLACAVLAQMWVSRITDGRLTRTMGADDRSAMLTRFTYLDDAFLQHAEQGPIADMLQAFPVGKKPTAEAYLFVLNLERPAPLWAVTDACLRARRGELKETQWAPLPSVLRAVAWHIALPFWQERIMLARVLAAKEPLPYESADKRKAVTERILGQLRARMGQNSSRII
jgi:hypothetical protein